MVSLLILSLLTATLIEDFDYIFGDKKAPEDVEIFARSLYDWEAEDDGQISFPEGAKIKVLKGGDPDGWWTGQYNGQTGLFPGNYVKVLDAAKGKKAFMAQLETLRQVLICWQLIY